MELVEPSKIVCVGRNYTEHIHELGNAIPEQMVLFLKPASSKTYILNSFQNKESLHYEGELCLRFNKGIFDAVTFGFDLTKRLLQSQLKKNSLPWERAKAFDGSAVIGDWVSVNSIDDNLGLELEVDGQLIQKGCVGHMLYKPYEILREIQSFITLNDGDIVMTGTPAGVGQVCSGSTYRGRVLQGRDVLFEDVWIAQ